MEIKNLTCINCPVGCSLKVEMDGSHVTCVSGNTCRRGEVYARKEVTNPTRIVTTTVKVVNGTSGTVSVKTKEDFCLHRGIKGNRNYGAGTHWRCNSQKCSRNRSGYCRDKKCRMLERIAVSDAGNKMSQLRNRLSGR